MTKKRWVYSPKKQPKPKVSDEVKQEVLTKANELIETVLKPKNVQPPPENQQFNYIVDIYTKWYRNYFYFYAKYRCPSPHCIEPFFDAGFARMEYVAPGHFNLSYMRHTDKWAEIYTDLSLKECLTSIKEEPFFVLS
ncbi:hypothetical protein ACFLYO_05770 [Chloroflexota bacterium]